jgi:hypothetical protein
MRPAFFLPILLFCQSLLTAQENPGNMNRILDDDIRSVQIHVPDQSAILPIINLKTSRNSLVLEFDHLGTDLKDYIYTIALCNSDWQPTELDDNQYIDGFTEDRIVDITNSINTLAKYTHYTLGLPNSNMKWSKSGNYLLKVFDNDNDKKLVLARRFIVVDPQWIIDPQFVSPVKVSKLNTHHEIDFTVNPKDTRIFNPQSDVKAYIIQNGSWDNGIGPLPPYITRSNLLVYDYQDKIIFPAGNDFRYFSMRTFDFRQENVKIITQKPEYYEVTLKTEKNRAGKPFLFYNDINGQYIIDNANANQTLQQCDYAKVLFSVEQGQILEGKDVYVIGELSDWQLKREFKMEYVDQAHMYVCEPFLKQGYYNYEFAVVDHLTGELDEEGLEGNWFEASNQYTILMYYRPFGSRYDQLLGAVTVSSRK